MQKLIAANWKMFKTRAQAKLFVEELAQLLPESPEAEVVVFPPFTALESTLDQAVAKAPWLQVGAQNFYPALEGPFTGEISPSMLLDVGVNYSLVGHSERRQSLHESLDLVSLKTSFALNHGLKVVLCIGETLAERQGNQLEQVLKNQLAHLRQMENKDLLQNLNIAYEPIWAIGTGQVATAEDIVSAHTLIKQLLSQILPVKFLPRLLYGGSVKPENAPQILQLEHVDGLLVGGASLQARSFVDIIKA